MFTLPPNNSHFWTILMLGVLIAGYSIVAQVGTKNGFDVSADLKSILTIAAGVIGVRFLQQRNPHDGKKEETK